MRSQDEINEVRREASARLRAATRIHRLHATAVRKSEALQRALEAMIEHRAVELGVDAGVLPMNAVLVSSDEKAVARETWKAAAESGGTTEIGPDDTMDHVVARVAVERGWKIVDAARAILNDPDARVDDIRNGPPHAKARRVRQAVLDVVNKRVESLDRQLDALRRGGPAMQAAPALLAGALVAFVAGREMSFEALVAVMQAERARLAKMMG